MDAQDLQDVECEGFLDSGLRRNGEKKAPELQRYHHKLEFTQNLGKV